MAYTTIDDPTAHFQVGLYTSNTSAEVACTFDGNSAMQPDLVIKSDRDVAQSNPVVDSSRGVDKILLTNGDYVEIICYDMSKEIEDKGFKDQLQVIISTQDLLKFINEVNWK